MSVSEVSVTPGHLFSWTIRETGGRMGGGGAGQQRVKDREMRKEKGSSEVRD